MRYIVTEQQFNFLINEIKFDPKVVKIQQVLVDKGYNLGKYGPNNNGVDGKMGEITKKAYEKEFGKKLKDSEPSSKSNDGDTNAILIGGLDYRSGDLSIDSQVEKFKENSKFGNVKGFRYNTPTSTILDFLKSNPNTPVYMFSAGCTKSNDISNLSLSLASLISNNKTEQLLNLDFLFKLSIPLLFNNLFQGIITPAFILF